MIVTFVSQCEKRALKKTRRVLDAFADRIGQRTWQTSITKEGLKSVQQSLRKTASKNTAVACHLIRSRTQTDLLWIVGQQHQFNDQGLVPVNRTLKNIAYHQWESYWDYATVIQIVAVIAALLHDLGKATVGFQNKLQSEPAKFTGDPYRHEWLSLKLFIALIEDCHDDQEWLTRFADLGNYLKANPEWYKGIDQEKDTASVECLPPLARLISWLIVSHHRLPIAYDKGEYYYEKSRREKCKNQFILNLDARTFYSSNCFKALDGWVKNAATLHDNGKDHETFWHLKEVVTNSQSWQSHLKRWVNKALGHKPLWTFLYQFNETGSPDDPFVWYLARLCLMVGDHNYSSLPANDVRRVKGDKQFSELAANTRSNKNNKKVPDIKQTLDEHLIGVGKETAHFAHMLPQLPQRLPKLPAKHRPFLKRSHISRFQWQNQSYDLARAVQQDTEKQGFFGVNMASTGCGKTLANARIMHGLGGKEGARFTIALGLRVLTMQTADALQEKLQLDDTSLAMLVGGEANRDLYNLDRQDTSADSQTGSESEEELVKELIPYDAGTIDESQFGTVVSDSSARRLLYTPIVSCTIDHIISASECIRGGRYIAPALRLLTSDLVLDEPDEFGQDDLPALSRLVHLAGLFGSRVLLSSATLSPDMVSGLFAAYQSGREIYNKHTGKGKQPVKCVWFDENKQWQAACGDGHSYQEKHQTFTRKRGKFLAKQPVRRKAEIMSLDEVIPANDSLNYAALANMILQQARQLHDCHHETDNEAGKTVSVGIVRFANIQPLVRVIRAMYQNNIKIEDTALHICCYHAKQLPALRSALENKLDKLLNRKNAKSLLEHQQIQQTIGCNNHTHQIFIVIASPVAEVGRDHDYDWAIIEPSSMRSIIQLAGRVWRHRPELAASQPNISIMESNIRALKYGSTLGIGNPVFTRPGFESKAYKLESHRITELIAPEQLQKVDSVPRINKSEPLEYKTKLDHLEHAVMQSILNASEVNIVNAFWAYNKAHRAWGHLQLLTPFRHQQFRETSYYCEPDIDLGKINFYEYESPEKSQNNYIKYDDIFDRKITSSDSVQPWLNMSVESVLTELSERLGISFEETAKKYTVIDLEDTQDNEGSKFWCFHPYLGFWRNWY